MKKEVLKKCTCGDNLTVDDMQYIGKMEAKKINKVVYLFNCKSCRTTFSLKIN